MVKRREFLIFGVLMAITPNFSLASESTRNFRACTKKVYNRGIPPESFLNELIDWARQAPDEIFAPNNNHDIYASVVNVLGPWRDNTHRKAAMLEVLRVLGGFESSWDWKADVDINNPNSNTICTAEAGIFQCSGDSMSFDPSLKDLVLATVGNTNCKTFREETKNNHKFAIEYCARLIRFTTKHHGPIKHKHIHKWLRKDAVAEFESFLA
jgi:hypothetical protein